MPARSNCGASPANRLNKKKGERRKREVKVTEWWQKPAQPSRIVAICASVRSKEKRHTGNSRRSGEGSSAVTHRRIHAIGAKGKKKSEGEGEGVYGGSNLFHILAYSISLTSSSSPFGSPLPTPAESTQALSTLPRLPVLVKVRRANEFTRCRCNDSMQTKSSLGNCLHKW